jgi:hypothetical protein
LSSGPGSPGVATVSRLDATKIVAATNPTQTQRRICSPPRVASGFTPGIGAALG